MPDQPILRLEDLNFGYAGRPALFTGLCFALAPGEQVGLYGPNGCGKTTLLRLIMGLESAQSGRVLFHGAPVNDPKSLHRLRCNVGLVLQNSDDQLFSPTVLEDVAFGPLNLGLNKREAKDRAMETLEGLGLAAFAPRPTQHLSGGEKKMVSIASVLAMRPEALLLDEPTAFLDDSSREKIVEILKLQSIARIIVSHDKDFLEQTTSARLCIKAGRLEAFSA
ncbi:energy-coupling factor ABC transporter ATP-binding protein [Desulfovibrio sp. OttesenSCG-928-C14]|nr:energy-coupling factor ABC transporter ATP-binding protein [Desulfovibrio sp. OttesenSCG-928-C14]